MSIGTGSGLGGRLLTRRIRSTSPGRTRSVGPVQAGPAGTYTLAAAANDQGYASAVGPIASIVVEGEPLPIGIGGSLTAPPLPHHRAYGSVHGGSAD
jgi:hypothetical protein